VPPRTGGRGEPRASSAYVANHDLRPGALTAARLRPWPDSPGFYGFLIALTASDLAPRPRGCDGSTIAEEPCRLQGFGDGT
jgi:hypothetical protein